MRHVNPSETANVVALNTPHLHGATILAFANYLEKQEYYSQRSSSHCVYGYFDHWAYENYFPLNAEDVFGVVKHGEPSSMIYFGANPENYRTAVINGQTVHFLDYIVERTKSEAVAMLRHLAFTGEVDWNAGKSKIIDLKPKGHLIMRNFAMAASLAAAMLVVPTLALADTVTLCSGKPNGGYDGLMRAIGVEIERQGHTVTVLNTEGSETNLNNLEAGVCSYAPAQRDVYYLRAKSDQGFQASVPPASVLYNEAMHLVCTSESGYDELEDIAAEDTIIVDTIGSGSALTMETLRSIESEHGGGDDWSKAKLEYTPLDEAAASMSLGTAKCAFGVGKLPSKWVQDMVGLGMFPVEIYDKDINDLEFNGGSLYPEAYVPKRADTYGYGFYTYKVPAVLFTSMKAKPSAEIAKIVKRIAPSLGAKLNTVE